jgi:dTDP-4-dehydrorhamnose reductase
VATETEELRVVRDQRGTPTWSGDIAQATTKILAQLESSDSSAADSFSRASGIYNLTGGGETTWYDFARAILEEAAHISPDVPWFAAATQGRPLIVKRTLPITTAEYPTPASRPQLSVLSNSRLNKTFGIRLPDWRSQLRVACQSECCAPVDPPRL